LNAEIAEDAKEAALDIPGVPCVLGVQVVFRIVWKRLT
jgi:hypothetical protein